MAAHRAVSELEAQTRVEGWGSGSWSGFAILLAIQVGVLECGSFCLDTCITTDLEARRLYMSSNLWRTLGS